MASAWKLPYDPDYVSQQLHLSRRGLVEDIFENKGRKNFLHSPMNGVSFTLHREIEDVNVWVMYESYCNKFKLQFARNVVTVCIRPKAFVAMDPYNSLKADIHNDLVGSGGAFMLLIYAWREDHYEN